VAIVINKVVKLWTKKMNDVLENKKKSDSTFRNNVKNHNKS